MASSTFWRFVGVLVALVLTCWIIWTIFDRTTVDLQVRYGPSASAATQSTPTPAPKPPPSVAAAPDRPAAPATSTEAIMATALSELASASREQAQASREQATAFNRQAEAFDRLSGQLSGRSPAPTGNPDCPAGCVSGVQHVTPRRN